jgi:lycopene beta-cyclase
MDQTDFDFIIAGGGASGLSLMWNLINSPNLGEKQILILDKDLKPRNDKTWCFWDDDHFPVSDLIHHTWDELTVKTSRHDESEYLRDYKYHCVRSVDYSEYLLKEGKKRKNVHFIEAPVNEMVADNGFGIVKTTGNDFKAPLVFQSILPPPSYKSAKVDNSLIQHFLGWEIITDSPIFDPTKALLMDFDVPQMNGVTFMYVLPFSETRALIEYTVFSEKVLPRRQYSEQISSYITKKYGLDATNYTVEREEFGKIPMEDKTYSPWYCDNIYSIGSVGGQTKPTTGYTFTRIQSQCKKIVHALEHNQPLPQKWMSSYRFRVYDIMLLSLLKNEPDTVVKIFGELFKRNSFDRILHFLDEKTNLLQEISIFSSLPYIPFFKSIYKMKHRILTGA